MKVILTENVNHLGQVGDMVAVKPGYARNFLIPRKLAALANESNKSALAHQIRLIEKKKAKAHAEAKVLAASIEKTSVTVAKQVGEDEKIFGTVTTAELEELLRKEGVEINKKDIHLEEDVKKVGVYSASVKLHPEVTAKFKVWVVAQ